MPVLHFQLLLLNKLLLSAVTGLTNVIRAVDCMQIAIKASSDDKGQRRTHSSDVNVVARG